MSISSSRVGKALENRSVGLLGLGRMGEAILAALWRIRPGPRRLVGYCRRESRRKDLADRYGMVPAASATELVNDSDVVLLAVKPFQLGDLLDSIAPSVRPDKLFVSVVAGVTLDTLQERLGDGIPVVRAMCNTPLTVGHGATVVCPGPYLRDGDLAAALDLFRAAGMAEPVTDEGLLDVVTGLVGSSPAFLFVAIEAMADAAVLKGLPRGLADRLARQVMLGAGALAAQSDQHVAALRDAVTSPGGTTAAGLRALEERGFRAALINAVSAAADRSMELGREVAGD